MNLVSTTCLKRGIFVTVISACIIFLMRVTTLAGASAHDLFPTPTPIARDTLTSVPNLVIGPDTRTHVADVTALPYRMIVKLRLYFPSGKMNNCTGWFAGPHTILTAAHCLYDGTEGWSDLVEIYLALDDGLKIHKETLFNNTAGCSVSDSVCDQLRKAADFTGADWDTDDWLFDYGAIVLDDNELGNLTGWFIAEVVADADLASRVYTLSGYPCDLDPGDPPEGCDEHWEDSGGAEAVSGSWPADYLKYYIDTGDGQSGAPVFYYRAGVYSVNGIHKGADVDLGLPPDYYNYARRITWDVMDDLHLSAWGAVSTPQICRELDITVVAGGMVTPTIQTGYRCNLGENYFYTDGSLINLTAELLAGKTVIWAGTNADSQTGTSNQITMNEAVEYVTTTYLAIPTGLSASDGEINLNLSWDPVAGAASYRIYRAAASDGTKTLVTERTASLPTEWPDYSVTRGKAYHYWIKACIPEGCTDFSAADTGWAKLRPPEDLAASDGAFSDRIHLTWRVSEGESVWYEIDRAYAYSGTRTKIDDTDDIFYDDLFAPVDYEYYYWVRACNLLGCSSDSLDDIGWRNLEPPDSVTATNGAYPDKIRVSWSAMTGADDYEVYRATSVEGAKEHLGTLTASPFDDTSVQIGQIYYYWVQACTTPGCSIYSDYDSGWRQISPPGSIQASDGAYPDKVRVSWGSSTGATSYEIYRAETEDGPKTHLGEATASPYDDPTAISGATYFYWAKACNALDCSGFSDNDQGWRSGMAPGEPTNLQASDGDYTDKVRLTWAAAPDADYYEVYRATSSGGTKSLLGSLSGTSFDDTSATVGITYYYWVIACNIYDCSDYGNYNTGWRKISPPDSIQATDGAFTDKVQIGWSASSGATYYQVYRAATETGSKSLLASPTGTAYDDATAPAETTYYYWVSACNAYGCSGYSNYDTGWRDTPGTAPAKPANIAASNALTDKVQITWDEVLGAAYYKIYRDTNDSGSETDLLVSNITTPRYDDTAAAVGTLYHYWVSACNTYGCSSGFLYGGDATGYRVPAAPANVQAGDGPYTDKVRVTWNASTGATKYHVLRGTNPPSGSLVGMNITDTYFDDTSAETGVVYYYWVRACFWYDCGPDSAVNAGWRSGLPPTAPTGLAAAGDTEKVRLTWDAVAGTDYYEVYRKPAPSGDEFYILLGSIAETTYDDTTAEGNVYYRFAVKACNAYGCSVYSESVTGIRQLTPPDPPENVRASAGLYTDKVRLTWADPPRSGGFFEIYRSDALNGARAKIADVFLGELVYDDTSALPGVEYVYWVVAGNLAGMSAYSQPGAGWRGSAGLLASLPFYDDFETGELIPNWATYRTDTGRVRVADDYSYGGSYGLLLDDGIAGDTTSTAALILPIDLSGVLGAELRFWWREFSDENHPEDGVFIRDSATGSWCQALSFNNGPAIFTEAVVDLGTAASSCSMALTPDFQIKFQFYDNFSIATDGYAIDNVFVRSTDKKIYLPLVAHSGISPATDVQVNDSSPATQIRPDFAAAPDGRLYAVWEDFRNGPAGDIYCAYSTDDGLTWSADIRVNDDAAASAQRRYPKVATSPTGEVYVVWVDWRNDPNPTAPNNTPESSRDPDIYLSKWPAGGSAFQPNVLVYPDASPDLQDSPDVAVDASGNVYVAFYDRTNDIYYGNAVVAKSTNGGASFGAPVTADTHSMWALDPRLAIDRANNRLYLVYQGHPEGYYKPYFTRSTNGGATWSSDVRLDAGPGIDWYDAARDIDIAADDAGHVVVIWADERNDPDNCYTSCATGHDEFDIYANISSDGGATWLLTHNVQVNDDSTYGLIRYPQAAFASDGSLTAVWRDSRAGDNLGDIWLAVSTDYGATWGGSQRVDHAPYAQAADRPTLAVAGLDVHVLWYDDRNGDWDIYATRVE